MKKYIDKIKNKQNLTFDESKAAFEILMEGKASDQEIFDFLTLLSKKGEASDEIAGGVFVLRSKSKRVNIDATKSIDVSYTNSSNVGMEVYFGFIFQDGNITLDAQGASIGGPIGAGETIERSIDLNIPVIGNSWCISEDECASKPNNNGGGNPDGGPACSVQCTWEASVDYTKFEGAEITITGENTSTGYAALTGETITFDYIKAGNYNNCWGVSTEEVVAAGLNIFPNPATDLLKVQFDAASTTTIDLIDLTGKVVDSEIAQAGSVSTSFTTADINAGIYFVNIKNAVGSTTQKVVVK